LTKVTLLEVEIEQCKALTIATYNQKCKALYKAFGVLHRSKETQETLQPPTAAEVVEHTKNLTRSMLTTKQPEEPLTIKVVTTHGHNHTYIPSTINQPTFPKKPTTGRSPAGHYSVPPTSKLKQSYECFYYQCKGHYACQCHTRKKELKQEVLIYTTSTTPITNDNRYKP
jgi:hypothetical protein